MFNCNTWMVNLTDARIYNILLVLRKIIAEAVENLNYAFPFKILQLSTQIVMNEFNIKWNLCSPIHILLSTYNNIFKIRNSPLIGYCHDTMETLSNMISVLADILLYYSTCTNLQLEKNKYIINTGNS